jgi:gliding motility-associated-like protein
MIGDGFGGRLWYRPTNYGVGSYTAFSLCYTDPCDTSSTQLYGWGADNNGELGNGPNIECSDVPVPIPGMSNVRYFSTGYFMGAIKNDSTGWIWSHNTYADPTQVLDDVKFVDASNGGVVYVKYDGTVWGMGYNGSGELGDGTTTQQFSSPVQMAGVTDAVRVASGQATNYVLLADSTVLAVGSNFAGLLGDPAITAMNTTTVAPVVGLSRIIDIKAGTWATAALDADGDVFCWGLGNYAGDGPTQSDSLPDQLTTLSNIVAISACADGLHFLALDAYGNCYAWGDMNIGSIFWAAPMLLEPVLIATNVIDIMAGELFTYLVKADGTLWASGLSSACSVWLDQPQHSSSNPQIEFIQLDPGAVASGCALQGTVAIPTTDCNGNATITVSHFGGQAPYLYDIGNGPQSSNVFTGLSVGTYTVNVTDANGCVTTASCTTDPNDAQAVLDLLDDVTICTGEQYTLPWGDLADTAGTYMDTVPSSQGCDTVRVLTLSIVPYYHAFLLDTICDGATTILPSGAEVGFSPFPILDTVQTANACDTVYHVQLVLGSTSAFIIAIDTVAEAGTAVTMAAVPSPPLFGSTFNWYPSTGLSCSDCPSPSASPMESTLYCVVVSNSPGCPSDTACQWITVPGLSPPICTPANIFVPTAFSPDASGKNDQHCVHGTECIASMALGIYDRWGNKVFESTDPEACWDGTYKGQMLDPAVFVYHLIATLDDGELVERKGNITLVR